MRPARYKVFYGGRDSAKSWSFAEALVRKACHAPIRWLCTREYQNSIADSVHYLLKKTIYRLGLQGWFDVTEKSIKSKIGAEFVFKGLHHNIEEIKSTESLDGAWVEEGQTTSENSWAVLIPTVRKQGSEIWCSFNVTDENAPTYKRFVTNTPPDTILHKVSYEDNPFLSDTSKKEIAWLKAVDFNAYQHVYLGLPLVLSDSIIFAGRFKVEDFPEDLWKEGGDGRLFIGMDHGFARDPYAIVRSFIHENKLYIEYEAFGVGVEFAGNMTDDGRGELEQLIDSVPGSRVWPMKADDSRPETISFCRGKGFNVTAADKWKGCVEDGIAHLKGFEAIIIHPRCKHMQQEARLYSFKRDPKTGEVLPIIVDANNHGWDAVRYSLDGYIQQRGDLAIWARLAKD